MFSLTVGIVHNAAMHLSPSPRRLGFLGVHVSVCLLVTSHKNHWSDLQENFTRNVFLDTEELIHIFGSYLLITLVLSAAGPRVWNDLPPELQHDISFGLFRCKLKSHLFV